MLDSLRALYSSKHEKPTLDIQQATAVLLYEVVRADSHVSEQELLAMKHFLQQLFNIDGAELEQRMTDAAQLAQQATSLHPFTKEICRQWNHRQRKILLEYFWRIALVDNNIQKDERHLVRKLSNLLYLNEKDIQESREKARKVKGKTQ